MPAINLEKLRAHLRNRPAEPGLIKGIMETDSAWYLGRGGLSKVSPAWIFGFSGVLSDSSRFYAVPFASEGTGEIETVAVIFRQFDQSPYRPSPSEYFAGWAPPEILQQLEGWVAEMNRHLEFMLAVKHQRALQKGCCTKCQEPWRPRRPAARELRGERYWIAFTLECPSCGHTKPVEAELDYTVESS